MSIQIDRVQALQQMNRRSSQRVLEVSLSGVPQHPPCSELRTELLAAFDALYRPPSDVEWFQQFLATVSGDADYVGIIAAIASYLQQHVVRYDGQVWFEKQVGSAAVVALECLEFEVGLACLSSAANIVSELSRSRSLQLRPELSQLQTIHEEHSLGAVTGPIVAAARRQNISVFRLDKEGLVQFGQGKNQRRIRRSCTDATGYVADLVSTDKSLAKKLWKQIGIPIAHGREVFNSSDAIQAAREIGWPVVVKPCDRDCGAGVRVNLSCDANVEQAYHQASAGESRVMVERQLTGNSYRLLLVDQQVISAVCRLPALVMGDGEHSVRELLEILNCQANRGPDRRWHLLKLGTDSIDLGLLSEQGLDLESVPSSDRTVWLRRDLDYSSTHEVLDQVHPSTLLLASDAARVIGLDVAGIDLIAADIGRPLEQQNGGFLEINSYPGIALHLAPICDKPRPVPEAIVSMLFSRDRSDRVPSVLVVGNVADHQILKSLFESAFDAIGPIAVSTSNRTELDDQVLFPSSPALNYRIGAMMLHPRTAGAIVTASLEELIEHGVGLDLFDLVVLLESSTGSVEYGRWPLETVKSMTNRLLEHCKHMIVNVHDPIWSASIEPGTEAVTMIAESSQHSVVVSHAEKGGGVWTFDSYAEIFPHRNNHGGFADDCQQRLWARLMGRKQPSSLVAANS